MTEDQAIEKLDKELTGDDPEADHIAADGILCELLRAQGFTKLADKFYEVSKGFWYS